MVRRAAVGGAKLKGLLERRVRSRRVGKAVVPAATSLAHDDAVAEVDTVGKHLVGKGRDAHDGQACKRERLHRRGRLIRELVADSRIRAASRRQRACPFRRRTRHPPVPRGGRWGADHGERRSIHARCTGRRPSPAPASTPAWRWPRDRWPASLGIAGQRTTRRARHRLDAGQRPDGVVDIPADERRIDRHVAHVGPFR